MPNQPNARKARATPAFAKPPTGPPRRPATATGARGSRGASGAGPSRTVWITVAVIVVLAVGAAVIAIVSSGGSSTAVSPPGMEQTQPVTVTVTALPALADDASATDPAVATTAPTLAGLSFDGSPVTVTPNQTSATLVVFLAHWCPHCQREMPKLVQWDRDRKVPAGVNVIGIATATSADQPNYPPSTWLAKAGFPWPIMADSPTGDAATALGISSWPGFVLIGKDGKVLWRSSGEIDVTDLAAKITAALPKA
jgi:cytochrome c biogenesis protein CcmG/thiol:disulfide interchange protein DsbE